jgi:hypothetical protein
MSIEATVRTSKRAGTIYLGSVISSVVVSTLDAFLIFVIAVHGAVFAIAGVYDSGSRAWFEQRFTSSYGDRRRRYREAALTPGTEVTILGCAVERGGETVIADRPETPCALTDGRRRAAIRRYLHRTLGYGVGGLVTSGVALWGADGVARHPASPLIASVSAGRRSPGPDR